MIKRKEWLHLGSIAHSLDLRTRHYDYTCVSIEQTIEKIGVEPEYNAPIREYLKGKEVTAWLEGHISGRAL